MPNMAAFYSLDSLVAEMDDLEKEIDRLEDESHANLEGRNPTHRDSEELRARKRELRALLAEFCMKGRLPHVKKWADTPCVLTKDRLCQGHVRLQHFDRPSQKALRTFLEFKARTFEDVQDISGSARSKDYFVLCPKQAQLDKTVRDLLQNRTWREIFVSSFAVCGIPGRI